ncbi:unnamed protein product [Phytophthora lilii]|uniref:Unnamed protein product n=1 Tax=Phytophthora lilii TaxID=2077276 RepID=A0A9W6X8X2_9STRA|nr:unnamed protein product [Phytophthora lilii]
MFPSFTNLSQRERKRQELLREAEKELAIERSLNQRYAETMWAADNEAVMIPVARTTYGVSTQTDGTQTAPATTESTTTESTTTPVLSALSGDISIPTISSTTQTSDMVNLDTDHIMYRPDETMDEAVSKREDTQTKSYKAVQAVYQQNPDIAGWDLHPLFDPMQVSDAKAKRDMYFLGPDAKLYHRSTRKAVRKDKQEDLIDLIDWEATFEYIFERMRLVDCYSKAREVREKLAAKRGVFNALRDNVGSDDRDRLGESRSTLDSIIDHVVAENMSKDSRTNDIEVDAKKTFMQIVKNNRKVINDSLLHDFNGKSGFYAVGRSQDLRGLPGPLSDYYIDPINFRLRQVSNHRQTNTKVERKRLSWANSLQFLFQSAQNNGIQLDTSGTSIRSATKRALEDSTVSNLDLEQKRPNLNELSRAVGTDVNMVEAAGDYKKLVHDLYTDNPWLLQEYLPPALSKLNKQYNPNGYYIDLNAGIRRIKGNAPDLTQDQLASPQALSRMNLSWSLTFQGVLEYLIQAVKFYIENPDLLREHRFEDKLQQIRDSLRRYNIVIPSDAPGLNIDDLEMTNDVRGRQTLGRSSESPGSQPALSGRGLKGAGYINKELRDKEGNPIKYHSNRGYNLAQLEGTGTYSSMAYKRVGTKFVHLPKLNENLLKVVYPNRSTVGPQRKISDDLAQLIKTLVFDGTIDQQLYDSMSMGDKRVFHELLRITHTQHAMRDPVKDPREVLKQEYMKLKGEVMLGNDNPELIRELKKVLVDMYSAKLISDDEFKQVFGCISIANYGHVH